jgi:hypothetical protein
MADLHRQTDDARGGAAATAPSAGAVAVLIPALNCESTIFEVVSGAATSHNTSSSSTTVPRMRPAGWLLKPAQSSSSIERRSAKRGS